MKHADIFELIKSEETAYQTMPVTVVENYDWHMYKHINTTTLYINSQYLTGNSDDKPFKNIIRPILNLQHRAEGFDVKDIQLFVNDAKEYYKSFLVKKYHEDWARENALDTFIDDMVESYVDYGGALVKDVNDKKPEVVPLQRLAFCDQTDILSGPICEKHFYSPDQLMDMADKGWGSTANGATATLDEVLDYAEAYKTNSNANGKQSGTPGRYVEVYEIHGSFPRWWLKKDGVSPADEDSKENDYVRQMHIVCFYKNDNGDKVGITLYKGKEKELPYKFIARDKIYGRALGMGGAEELFESQVWTNYDILRIKDLLDAAAKVIYQTADQSFKTRNKLSNLKNQTVLVTDEGKPISQINTSPVNIALFERSIGEWEAHARQTGAANESIMGESPTAGTPFKLQELVTAEAHSLHEYRKGKLATFLDEVYQDWIIPYISTDITKGKTFLSELDLDELQYVADSLVTCATNDALKDKILNGLPIGEAEIEDFKQKTRDEFMKGGNKKFIEILKDEMKDAPMSVKTNIVGKQKNLSAMTDKLTNVFRQVFSTFDPQTKTFAALDDPRMASIFNQILEYSGLEPVDFYQKPKPPQALQQPAQVGAGQLQNKEMAIA